MNLVNGKFLDGPACDIVLYDLENRIHATLSKERLDPEIVISACDKLVSALDVNEYLGAMSALGIDEVRGMTYIDEARLVFSAKNLRRRLSIELGETFNTPATYIPAGGAGPVTEMLYPLGVLLHVAAGNADGLPAFSVLEGLLTGNINILKLPAQEGGISVRLLQSLINVEPLLADYIYVFDYSSKDILHIRRLLSVSDAVVLWGGAEAVTAFRQLVPANVRIIEWGHKVSFGYVTEEGMTRRGLEGLAKNIAETGQLLCSSVQGIYLDTADMAQVHAFCLQFLPILEEAIGQSGSGLSTEAQFNIALKLYKEELEGIFSGDRLFKGKNCSLTACGDTALTTSIQFGNPWVKPLPRAGLIPHLHPYKSFLQSVGLVCGASEREALAEAFFKAGAVRVCDGENMSASHVGLPHDGEYPLRRYTKIVSLG